MTEQIKTLTRAEILERDNWTEEKIDNILCRPYLSKDGHPSWEYQNVLRVENYLSFKNFKNTQDYKDLLAQIDLDMEFNINQAQIDVPKLNASFNKDDKSGLMQNLDEYPSHLETIERIKEGFVYDSSKTYSLFTDGCFKIMGKESFASCAGWILENETNKIVAEFSKSVPLDKNKTREMPEFELSGIFAGVKLIEKLGLKNVNCYTDSVGEAKTIYAAILGVGDKRFYSNARMYDQILSIMLESNSKITWVPRGLNSHADALTKIPMNEWLKMFKQKTIEVDYFKKNGYKLNPNIDIYFSGVDKDSFDNLENSPVSITSIRCSRQEGSKPINLLCLKDVRSGKIQIIHEQTAKDYQELGITERLLLGADAIVNTVKALRLLKDYPEITLDVNQGMFAVLKNLAPIKAVLQEEYFELHKAMQEFPGKIKIKKMDAAKMYEINTTLEECGFGIKRKSKKASKM